MTVFYAYQAVRIIPQPPLSYSQAPHELGRRGTAEKEHTELTVDDEKLACRFYITLTLIIWE